MTNHDLLAALLVSLDDDTLLALAERLRPHLATHDGQELLGPKEAAVRLGLHERTVARMAREGRIPGAIKVGRGWRFPADQLSPVPPAASSNSVSHRPVQPRRNRDRASVRAIREAR